MKRTETRAKNESQKEVKSGLESRKILMLHYLQKMDYETIGKVLCVPSVEVSSCCVNFASKFSNEESLMEVLKSLEEQENCQEESPKAMEDEIKELRRRLKEAELRADAYDEMINVAESMFNIPIRKKAGAKR